MLYTMGYVKNKCCKAEHRTLFAASEEVISEGNEEAYVCVCVCFMETNAGQNE